MNTPVFRLAVAGDAALVQTISAAAYKPAYLAVVGFVPKPAVEDYSERIAQETYGWPNSTARRAACLSSNHHPRT